MTTFLITIGVMLLLALLMAVGLIDGRRLQGSCGGLATGDCVCDAEGRPRPKDCPRDSPEAHTNAQPSDRPGPDYVPMSALERRLKGHDSE